MILCARTFQTVHGKVIGKIIFSKYLVTAFDLFNSEPLTILRAFSELFTRTLCPDFTKNIHNSQEWPLIYPWVTRL